jgi:hypothetical protein
MAAHSWVAAQPNPHAYDQYNLNRKFVSSGAYRDDRLFLDFGNRPAYDVGWKLHVVKPTGLNLNNYMLPQTYLRLLSYLRDEGIPHKIVRNLANLAIMEQSPSQIGKFITIYPRDTAELTELVDAIEILIPENATNPCAVEDHQVGARGLVGARWGGLTSEFSVDHHGAVIDDDRSGPYRPGWVRNPFDSASTGQEGWVRFDEDQQRDMQIIRRNRRRGGQ